jgi:SAM-dependent methyltransferase
VQVPNSLINLAKKILPPFIYLPLKNAFFAILKFKYLKIGRKYRPGDTSKAKNRRTREGFFEKYCRGEGIDIGCGDDKLGDNCLGWDLEHGDAQYLKGIEDHRFDFVYSSHTLEHFENIEIALTNWWRVLKPGGYLILYLPHRDLYEKKKILPSRWNPDHKHFFLIDRDEKPDTIGIVPFIKRTLKGFEIIYAKECGEGHTITDPGKPSDGEYSIEVVVKKLY